ncbi:Hcp family type VI secretion system effector, partial [Pseudomonas cichorii]|nr:Hcp family type VI secretion system effector [Pseudomonas cichorii]
MATPAYMSITGEKQGLITAGAFTPDSVGNTFQEGHEDEVMVQAFHHDVIIPRDPQSGQPTGQRVHKPVKITKVFDKSSPLLQAALTSGERLSKVEIKWFRTSAQGTQEH